MHRFYIPSLKVERNLVDITDNRIVHQVGKVLRMWKDDQFHIFDESGKELLVEITEINKRHILAHVLEEVKNNTEPKINVVLYQAIPKKPALFELVVQKATEIGVTEIFPLITERTENRRMAKFDRMQLIAVEAAEQCGRSKVPIIRHPISLEDASSNLTNAYIAYEYEGKKFLSDYKDLHKEKALQVIIGPEGGFSQKEVEFAKKAKVKPFSLGSRILRTETAAISAMSLILLNGEK